MRSAREHEDSARIAPYVERSDRRCADTERCGPVAPRRAMFYGSVNRACVRNTGWVIARLASASGSAAIGDGTAYAAIGSTGCARVRLTATASRALAAWPSGTRRFAVRTGAAGTATRAVRWPITDRKPVIGA